MNEFDDIQEDENGFIKLAGWIKWKHIAQKLIHCPVCLNLNGCWFNNILKPEYPQHHKCHCVLMPITKPRAEINAFAKCDIKKFTDYIFSDKYARNGKRDLFMMLGFTLKDSKYLRDEYEHQAVKKYCESEYELGILNIHGQRIEIDIELEKNGRSIKFSSGWMVRPDGIITNNTPLAN